MQWREGYETRKPEERTTPIAETYEETPTRIIDTTDMRVIELPKFKFYVPKDWTDDVEIRNESLGDGTQVVVVGGIGSVEDRMVVVGVVILKNETLEELAQAGKNNCLESAKSTLDIKKTRINGIDAYIYEYDPIMESVDYNVFSAIMVKNGAHCEIRVGIEKDKCNEKKKEMARKILYTMKIDDY